MPLCQIYTSEIPTISPPRIEIIHTGLWQSHVSPSDAIDSPARRHPREWRHMIIGNPSVASSVGPDEATGELEEAEVVLGLLLVADE
jgi:hypothetical protein